MSRQPFSAPPLAHGFGQANLSDELRTLMRLTQSDATPSTNALNEVLRDLTAMKFDIKFFGYEMARKLAEQLPPAPTSGPHEIGLMSKPSTQADLEAKGYEVAPLDFDVGNAPMDRFIDIPPYTDDWQFDQADGWASMGAPHVKLAVDGFPATCFGIIARKN